MGEKDWIAALQNRDPEAMNQIMNQYARLLWTIAAAVLKNVGNEQDVEECVADAFIWLWENACRVDLRRGSLKAVLTVVTRSRAIDRYRELCRKAALPLEEAAVSAGMGLSESMIQREEAAALYQAVESLSDPVREIVIRRFYQNQKPREIALAMDLTVKQVNNALYRGKQLLRKQLREA